MTAGRNKQRLGKKKRHLERMGIKEFALPEKSSKASKEAWVLNKSNRKNYRELGLLENPNRVMPRNPDKPRVPHKRTRALEDQLPEEGAAVEGAAEEEAREEEKKTEPVVWKPLDDSEKERRKEAVKKVLEVAEEDGRVKKPKPLFYADIVRTRLLLQKHGLDYKAMYRDIKINVMQLSKGQLRNQIYVYFMAHSQPGELDHFGFYKDEDGALRALD